MSGLKFDEFWEASELRCQRGINGAAAANRRSISTAPTIGSVSDSVDMWLSRKTISFFSRRETETKRRYYQLPAKSHPGRKLFLFANKITIQKSDIKYISKRCFQPREFVTGISDSIFSTENPFDSDAKVASIFTPMSRRILARA